MAPDTSTNSLPRSKFHYTVAAAAPEHRPLPTPFDGTAFLGNSEQAPPDPVPFKHPDHPPPARVYSGINTLIVVCCHAIFHPDPEDPSFPLQSPFTEANWHLAPFQTSNPKTGKPGEHEAFLAHIEAGIQAISVGSCAGKSILVFSGGATKSSLTALSEARSYYHAAMAYGLAQGEVGGGRAKLLFDQGRILLEEDATDSFQNLLFSVLLFRRTTRRYPQNVRIITHAFKARRFLDLHAPAIQWPPDRVRVQGIDPVMSSAEHQDTASGEERFGYGPWMSDPFGTAELLSGKRRQRGWREERAQDLGADIEETVQQLLRGKVSGVLPWSSHSTSDSEDYSAN